MPRLNRWGSRACVRAGADNHARRHRHWLGLAIAGAVMLLAPTTDADAATCRGRNFVDSLGLVLGVNSPIRATSGNGQTYDRIESAKFTAQCLALCQCCRP